MRRIESVRNCNVWQISPHKNNNSCIKMYVFNTKGPMTKANNEDKDCVNRKLIWFWNINYYNFFFFLLLLTACPFPIHPNYPK